ncbi:MAG: ferrous iron transport protein B [Planctomycetia bacterium]|nr:ferrous iron transport protein B [Planctomycetia bacterium]
MATTSPRPTRPATQTVALIGNPNTGKSTLFSALCGIHQRVGNYPGVTVEKKLGRVDGAVGSLTLIDLPGTYSLAPRSPDEMIAIDVLLGHRSDVPPPDTLLCIVDAGNLQRNLYLVSQVLELGRPTVVALNMMDHVTARQIKIDVDRLAQRLGVPVIPIQANRRVGLEQLRQALFAASEAVPRIAESPFPRPFQTAVEELGTALTDAGQPLDRYLVERLLLDTGGYLAEAHLNGTAAKVIPLIATLRERLAGENCQVPAIEAIARYQWVGRMLDGVVTHPPQRPVTLSDRLDRVLTHKVWGSVIFLALMTLMFTAVFKIGKVQGDIADVGMKAVGGFFRAHIADGPLQSLVVKGIVGGVGNVLVFLPQIALMFLFIAVLEDCGYMARAAYLMDKLMSRVGLSGKSFIPLLSSFACAIPGIMAARVIENRRDRLITVLVAPLMSCSARLPVYLLLTAAIIPSRNILFGLLSLQVATIMAMYLLGIVVAVGAAFLLRHTLLKGPRPPFVMELPAYKVPSVKVVSWRAGERAWEFVRRAGTMIFAVSVVVWAAGYYPRHSKAIDAPHHQELATLQTQIDTLETAKADAEKAHGTLNEAQQKQLSELNDTQDALQKKIAGDHLRQSYLGQAGHAIEPLVRPLGWDWRIGCAAIASFPAREVLVGTLGVIYNLGSEEDEESPALREQLQTATKDGSKELVYNVPVALSLMVFIALCAQCASTLVVLKRETNSWRWPAFTFFYMTTLAYVGAMITYQVGIRLMG